MTEPSNLLQETTEGFEQKSVQSGLRRGNEVADDIINEDLLKEFMIIPGLSGYIEVLKVMSREQGISLSKICSIFLKEFKQAENSGLKYPSHKAYAELIKIYPIS
jgi:hypothetical protein